MPSWWQPLGPALNSWPVGPAQQPAAADNHSTIQLSPRALKEQLAVEKAPAAPSPTEGPRLQTLELENIRMSGALKEQVAKAKEQQVRLQKAAELLRELDAENSVLREELATVKADQTHTAESVRALEAEVTRLRKAFLNAELGGKSPIPKKLSNQSASPVEPPAKPSESAPPAQDEPNPEEGKLRVKFVRATNLPSVGSFDPDCYIKFMWRGEKHKTAVQDGTNNPVWNESFELSVNKSEYNTPIVVKVWDKNALSSNEWIGECDVHFDKLRKGKTVTENYGLIKLSPRANRPSRGSVIELTVELTAVDFNTAPRPEAEQGAKQPEAEQGAKQAKTMREACKDALYKVFEDLDEDETLFAPRLDLRKAVEKEIATCAECKQLADYLRSLDVMIVEKDDYEKYVTDWIEGTLQ